MSNVLFITEKKTFSSLHSSSISKLNFYIFLAFIETLQVQMETKQMIGELLARIKQLQQTTSAAITSSTPEMPTEIPTLPLATMEALDNMESYIKAHPACTNIMVRDNNSTITLIYIAHVILYSIIYIIYIL